ncbi:hypothetical protein TRFO_12450 [Tritrichomonas foetus]|uniref:Uncharacterized protein n=1 Tax=Tritrichomonas foetus TaxID=1144522 RepID=A0A1J4L2J7_9EUKA|nr:hypothetical protein TRFO_12450 [Tritrichomonas foetus]|eukprot:OHT17312.1 hypothetical protein TRFO_12450 [Tritrichomonas foetus]
MSSKLAPKRKIQSARNWTPGVSDFIRKPMKFDEFVDENFEIKQKQYPQTSRTRKRGDVDGSVDRYDTYKKAFDAKQRVRASQIQKYQDQCEKTERRMQKVRTPRCITKQREITSVPVKHMKDRHLIEHIVAQRNDDYMEVSEYIPQGYVADLGALRKLPPDNKTYVKTKKRIYYWG